MFSLHDSSTLSVCARRMGFEACWGFSFVAGWSCEKQNYLLSKKANPDIREYRGYACPDVVSISSSVLTKIASHELKLDFMKSLSDYTIATHLFSLLIFLIEVYGSPQ